MGNWAKRRNSNAAFTFGICHRPSLSRLTPIADCVCLIQRQTKPGAEIVPSFLSPNASWQSGCWLQPVRKCQPKILVVDDEALIRESVKVSLSGDGYEMHSARNAEEALAICEKS